MFIIITWCPSGERTCRRLGQAGVDVKHERLQLRRRRELRAELLHLLLEVRVDHREQLGLRGPPGGRSLLGSLDVGPRRRARRRLYRGDHLALERRRYSAEGCRRRVLDRLGLHVQVIHRAWQGWHAYSCTSNRRSDDRTSPSHMHRTIIAKKI
jgi:hypothetical protein